MRARIGFVFCLIGFAAAVLCGVLMALDTVGTDEGLYFELQMDAGILDSAGVSEEELLLLDGKLAQFLKGDAQALDGLAATVFGQLQPAFNEREMQHMRDSGALFDLLRAVMMASAVLAVGLIAVGGRMLYDRKWIRRAAWLAPLVLLIPLGALALWAVVDFGAAFAFFHEALFTNDLWLLNPATDLLIRICPESMFMAMGVRIGLIGLAWALLLPVLTMVLTAKKGRE